MEFPLLTQFIQGWFHQDFDLDGDDPSEIARHYCETSDDKSIDELSREISAFLERPDRSELFRSKFKDEIELEGFGLTATEFLQSIQSTLKR